MPNNSPTQISRRLAERHDVIFERLQALARKVEAQAARGPERAVPEAMRARAEALLFEAEPFRAGRRGGLPLAAPHFSGLAAQLGEALVMLVAFEMRHTQWNGAIADTMWLVPGTLMRPRRLLPKPGSKGAARAGARARQEAERRAAEMVQLRQKLVRRIDQYKQRDVTPELSPLSPADGAGP